MINNNIKMVTKRKQKIRNRKRILKKAIEETESNTYHTHNHPQRKGNLF